MSAAAPKRTDDLDAYFRELETLDPTPDPVHDWMVAHRDELAGLVGHHVAIDPARGLLASAESMDALAARLEALGLAWDPELTILTVR